MSDVPLHGAEPRPRMRAMGTLLALLILIVLVFAVRRVVVDSGNVGRPAGSLGDSPDRQYALHPWLAYLHIVPGVVYLLGAPLQLAHRFRSRHYTVHRRMGRVVLPSGVLAGIFALVFGVLHPVGGPVESAATVVFGVWFLWCLGRAYAAIRARDVATHGRFMIRAFAVATAVGTIRIIVGVMVGAAGTSYPTAFATGFWVAFALHVAAAEWWLRTRPAPTG